MNNLKLIFVHILALFVYHVYTQNHQDVLKHELDSLLYEYQSKTQLIGTVLVAKQGKVLY